MTGAPEPLASTPAAAGPTPSRPAAQASPAAQRWRSLRWPVLLGLAIAVVLPTAAVGIMSAWRATRDVERQVNADVLTQLRAVAASLDATLQDTRRAVELAAAEWADTRMRAPGAHATTPTETLDAPTESLTTASADARRVRRLKRAFPMLTRVSLVSPHGQLLAGDPLPPAIELGRDSFGGYISDAVTVGDHAEVNLVVQARDRTGALRGVAVCGVDLAFVREFVAMLELAQNAGSITVLDSSGRVIAQTSARIASATPAKRAAPARQLGEPAAMQQTRALAMTRAQTTLHEGAFAAEGWLTAYRHLSGFQTIRGINWVLIHQQASAHAYRLAHAARRDTLWVAVIALTLALGLGGTLAHRVVRALHALSARADAIAHGNTVAGPAVRGPGEIGELGVHIEHMAQRIGERAELAAALARGDRLASVGVMAAQLAHEINNPLTTVLGYAHLLLEDKSPTHADHAGLTLIAEEAQRMQQTVATLLRFARADQHQALVATPATEACNLATTTQHALALLAPRLRRGPVQVVLAIAPELAVKMPGRALEQVLFNLLQNALDAMAGRGTLALTATPLPGARTVELLVCDDGPGIAPADRARVFDPFFSTKQAGAGTGLGLAVCKHLLTGIGGSLELRYPPPQMPNTAQPASTCFALRLPLTTDRLP